MLKVGDLVRYKESLLDREIQYIVGNKAKVWGIAPLVKLEHLRKSKGTKLTSTIIWGDK